MIYVPFTVVALLLFLARRERIKYFRLKNTGRIPDIVRAQHKYGAFFKLAIL